MVWCCWNGICWKISNGFLLSIMEMTRLNLLNSKARLNCLIWTDISHNFREGIQKLQVVCVSPFVFNYYCSSGFSPRHFPPKTALLHCLNQLWASELAIIIWYEEAKAQVRPHKFMQSSDKKLLFHRFMVSIEFSCWSLFLCVFHIAHTEWV